MADEKGTDRAGLDEADKGTDRASLDDKGTDRGAIDAVQSILTAASRLGGFLVVAFVSPVPPASGAPGVAAGPSVRESVAKVGGARKTARRR